MSNKKNRVNDSNSSETSGIVREFVSVKGLTLVDQKTVSKRFRKIAKQLDAIELILQKERDTDIKYENGYAFLGDALSKSEKPRPYDGSFKLQSGMAFSTLPQWFYDEIVAEFFKCENSKEEAEASQGETSKPRHASSGADAFKLPSARFSMYLPPMYIEMLAAGLIEFAEQRQRKQEKTNSDEDELKCGEDTYATPNGEQEPWDHTSVHGDHRND
jgi:hypothetical protein